MAPAFDVGGAIGALTVPDRDIGDVQTELARAEKSFEIAEGVEIDEIAAVGRDLFVMGAAQRLGAAESVLELLAEHETEEKPKGLVGPDVEERHRAGFH